VEDVFRALGHPQRRVLLDRLFETDGQTLRQLDRHLPMTRFGTMKHLRVLEAVGLVLTRRSGREKLHYLNPVPIRLIHDRWIHKYAEPWVGALGQLKRELEGGTMSTAKGEGTAVMSKPRHVYEIFIRASAERVWEAIIRPEITRDYYYGTLVASDWKVGSTIEYRYPDGRPGMDGKVLEIDPPRRLVHTFSALWDDKVSPDRPHRLTWTIEPRGDFCRVSIEHDDFDGETATYQSMSGGTSLLLNALKTLLETGTPLKIGE
jgi:uncharacterized protein YndB with AHSA1/START domain/DNA-binding transcriptional ArsR family regulator